MARLPHYPCIEAPIDPLRTLGTEADRLSGRVGVDADQAPDFDLKTRLFEDFTQRRFGQGLTRLYVTTRQTPVTVVGSLHQQNCSVTFYEPFGLAASLSKFAAHPAARPTATRYGRHREAKGSRVFGKGGGQTIESNYLVGLSSRTI